MKVDRRGHKVDGTSILIAFVSPKKVEQKIYLSGCGLGGRQIYDNKKVVAPGTFVDIVKLLLAAAAITQTHFFGLLDLSLLQLEK